MNGDGQGFSLTVNACKVPRKQRWLCPFVALFVSGIISCKPTFAYDWTGHRLARHLWKGGTAENPTFQFSTRWLWDGWNAVAEYTAASEEGYIVRSRR